MKKTRSRPSQLGGPPIMTQINAKSPPSVNRRQQLLSGKPVAEEQKNMDVEVKQRRGQQLLSKKPVEEEQENVDVEVKHGQPVAPVEREKSKRIREMAGGTAAECAAICCCCPFGVMNLLILAVYKLPAGLCRKMWRRRKLRRKKRNALLQQRPSAGPQTCSCDEADAQMIEKGGMTAVDLDDDEMWARFYGAGFWRSCSQREA